MYEREKDREKEQDRREDRERARSLSFSLFWAKERERKERTKWTKLLLRRGKGGRS